MLTRALFLATGWLVSSFIFTILLNRFIRFTNQKSSLVWLGFVLLCGDLWALFTFGLPTEILLTTLGTFLLGWWWIRKLPDWNALGQVSWVMSLLTICLYIIYIFRLTVFAPLPAVMFVVAFVFFVIELIALGLSLSFTFEGLAIMCRINWPRQFGPFRPITGFTPKISLHVPAYNEPPEVVEETLRSLAKLNYPNYEVLVIDNNTPAEETWRPLELLCHELGPHFRCLHLENWPGYKSGALNFALTQTALDAEIIVIVDADYKVRSEFLRETVPAFANPQIAFVQTPQDYRGYQGNTFLEAAYYGYKYFFDVSMPFRNEHNAIIFAGTMGLIRKSVLQEIGGWDEWCITEDAEASLRILQRGYQSVFINKAYGKGLIPFTFEEFKKQRFRWCFGGIQILKKHWEAMMPWSGKVNPENKLSGAQKYIYLLAGLQWYNDLLNLVFTFFLILGGVLTLIPQAKGIRPLTGPLIMMSALFLIIGLWRFLWVLRSRLQLSWWKALQTMGNFFSLGWAVTLGSIQGLIQPQGVFLRTPKTKSTSGMIRAIHHAKWEMGIGLICIAAGVLILNFGFNANRFILALLLGWQAGLYLSAPAYSLAGVKNEMIMPTASQVDRRGIFVAEGRAARWAIALVAVLLIGGAGFYLAASPAETPAYSRFQPLDMSANQLLEFKPFDERIMPTPTLAPTITPNLTSTPMVELVIPTAVEIRPLPTATFAPVLPTATPLPTAVITSTLSATPIISATSPTIPEITTTSTSPVTVTATTQAGTSVPTTEGMVTATSAVTPATTPPRPSATPLPPQTAVPTPPVTLTSEPTVVVTVAPSNTPSPVETPIPTSAVITTPVNETKPPTPTGTP